MPNGLGDHQRFAKRTDWCSAVFGLMRSYESQEFRQGHLHTLAEISDPLNELHLFYLKIVSHPLLNCNPVSKLDRGRTLLDLVLCVAGESAICDDQPNVEVVILHCSDEVPNDWRTHFRAGRPHMLHLHGTEHW